ncbi:acyl-CoA dehydrogenase family protein [Novosphingobium sp.]|uniref:acyl-CoA dehydrogenase family protein n=1 Tax=Novosphingobium sp. TaxID=1874826 RepID=UPI0022C43490|nr:acyl-CoA dehydrogenase family protein [Novosphingobium sp.]MCZ8018380.1 acyl-CoA dehydrogenase family protein [Novosphingobium sp.]MCZ8033374.1 acyl-CoA dehydrogenase family protein [Novosphingobium sp.]MCZ8051829.1 acyl-CoA dehydrogenase family protein [Novosphingobium sp.]MCZ8060371.1 acyl-CoA dehydrogenase family protein [Novosphingobium sp.]MCZ8232013.1 acyl-CoA dehydrogenase family protein [Novosphingobium sp.]
MHLEYTPEQQAFRAEVRAWMEAHVPKEPLVTLECREGYDQHVEWERTLASGNWGMVTWPEAYGGRGLDLIQWLIFEEEYFRAGGPNRANQNGIFLLGPTIMEFGTEEQKARFLPPMARGEVIWAQAWSEPGAGSDMAAIQSKAVRDGDHYVITGQKTWSSRAAFADWGFGIFRTDPDSKRHKGLTFILFDLNSPGITRRPIRQLHGDTGFAELFFDEVRVPVENCLAGEGEGWNVAMATAGFERGLMLRSPGRFQATAKRLVELYRAHEAEASPAAREAVVQAWMQAQAYAWNTYAVAAKIMAGGKIGAEASLNKIFWSELDRAMHRTAMQILGAHAELKRFGNGQINQWLEGYIFSLSGPIYAGSNEVQRNIIAERLLGLPRAGAG